MDLLEDFKELDISNRTREFVSYSEEERDVCVFKYLFENYSYRKLEREVLHLNSDFYNGWQAMGILHHYGITDSNKGVLKGKDVSECISALESRGGDYVPIAASLRRYLGSEYSELESVVVSGNPEGRKAYYYTTKYERSSKNRSDAIRIHGTTCMVCGFDFEKVYGERGRGFIEVHHIKPLSSRNEEVIINPKTDLVCVCSNCHRMIHRDHENILTIEELRSMINSNGGCESSNVIL